MNKISAKAYYMLETGEVLVITSEAYGWINETTKEEDMEKYEQLKGKNIEEVGVITLEYGTLDGISNNAKSYKINLESKELEIIYYTQEELNTMQQQTQESQDLNSRVSDISTYLSNTDESTIADIENSILEIEKNKIINGGM